MIPFFITMKIYSLHWQLLFRFRGSGLLAPLPACRGRCSRLAAAQAGLASAAK